MTEDLYGILGVSKNSTPDEIKKAFKKLAIANHPDKNPDDKEKEETFKKVSTAYDILSNPDKKRIYDQTGSIDGNAAPPDMSEILKNVFGGGGMPGMHGMPGMGGMHEMPGGFSFSFSQGGDMFSSMFGGMRQQQQPKQDLIDVTIDICDLYYGRTKKVEFEMLEACVKCDGSGASDPSQIMNCMTCKGQGVIMHQIGPFIQKTTCPSCAGNGSCIKKPCSACHGRKTSFNKKLFELKLPKTVPNNHTVTMNGKGSYDVSTKKTKDIVFRFKYNIQPPYSIDDHCNVLYNLNINIEELLGGFSKKITLYNEEITVSSNRYFNPNNPMVIKEKGLFESKTNKHADLHLKFTIDFIDSDKLVKYKDIFHKIFKKKDEPAEEVTFTI